MLLTLLLWIYTTLLTFLAGDALWRAGRRVAGPLPGLAAPLVCLLGAAGLTVALGWAWLLVPINLTTHIILVILLAGYGIWQRPRPVMAMPRWSNQTLGWVTIGILFTVVWLRTSQQPRLADTGGYHAPMIEWIYRSAIVPGLANLNYRFGFNNAWFLLNALFRFPLATHTPWHGLNGWLMLMVGWFSLSEWQRQQQTRQWSFSAWLAGWLGLGFLLIFHWTLSSPSPDLPTHVYVVLCFWIWFRRAEIDQKAYAAGWAWLLLVLSLSALTTKLSAVTILQLPILLTGQMIRRGNGRGLLLVALTTLVVTGYWWVSNVILSGYVVYPSLSPLVDWFAVDWKVPRTLIRIGLNNLQQGTRGDTGSTFSLAWIPYWFRTRPLLEQGIFVALLMAPFWLLANRSDWSVKVPGYSMALVVAWTGIIFWFFLAPEIRFGAGSVLITLCLCYASINHAGSRLSDRGSAAVWGVICLIGVGLLLAALRREPVRLVLPAGYPTGSVRTYKAGSQPVFYPVDDTRIINGIRGYWGSCYDTDLPCSPYPMPGLRWRGKGLETGFRTGQSNTD